MFKVIQQRKQNAFLLFALFIAMTIMAGVAIGQSVVYHGNSQSRIFHDSGCRYYNCKNCTVEFSSKEKAIEAGYRSCKVCKP